MASNMGKFFHYYNEVYQKLMVEKFDTAEKKELQKLTRNIVIDFLNGKLIYVNSETVTLSNNSNLTDDEKLKKLTISEKTIKIWEKFQKAGYTPDQLAAFVNNGELPYVENKIFSDDTTIPKEEQKLELKSFGTTVIHTAKKIKQEDGSLRCLRCNRLLENFEQAYEKVDEYVKHVNDTHGELIPEERTQLMEIYPR